MSNNTINNIIPIIILLNLIFSLYNTFFYLKNSIKIQTHKELYDTISKLQDECMILHMNISVMSIMLLMLFIYNF